MTTVKETLEKISEKTGNSVEKLQGELTTILENFKKLAPSESEEQLKAMSINRLVSQYRKQMLSKGDKFEAFFIGMGNRFDMVKKKREAILSVANTNPEKALEDKMIDKDGNPLFWESAEKVAKMADWQKKNLGTKMPETDFKRSLFGIINIDGKFVKLELRTRGNNSEVIPKMFTKVSFTGFKLDNASTDTKIVMNDSGVFNPIESEEKVDESALLKILGDVHKNESISLNQLDEFIDAHNGEYNPLMVAKVNVIEISAHTTKGGSNIINVSDDTVDLEDIFTCWLPEYIGLNFPETAEIFIIGTPKRGDNGISIGLSGVYVPKIFRVQEDIQNVDGSTEIKKSW